jgi:hypothetical protein
MEQISEIETAGCDWLSMSWPVSDERINHIKATFSKRLNDLQKTGHTAKERKVMQYQGVGTEKLFFGRDDTHYFCMASSYEATETASEIIAARIGGQASRVDLQATASYPTRAPDYFETLGHRIRQSVQKSAGRKSQKGAHYFDAARDTGLSLGARGSDRSARIYSAREGGHPESSENAVRFEWQYRQERARLAWQMMADAPDLCQFAANVVKSEALNMGIVEPWMLYTGEIKMPAIKAERSIDKRFKWYQEQAFPSFAKTIEEGYGVRLLEELKAVVDAALINSQQAAGLELSAYKQLFGE